VSGGRECAGKEERQADNPDFRLSAYDFSLPEANIAQYPAAERSGSRLMILRRGEERCEQAMFADCLRYLPENCLLIANNSRVAPARLRARRANGGNLECLLLTPPPLIEGAPLPRVPAGPLAPAPRSAMKEDGWLEADAEALLRPARKIAVGEWLRLAPDFALSLVEHGPYGRCRVRLRWRGALPHLLEKHGEIPLPPYIRRGPGKGDAPGPPATGNDRERYQTLYARADKAGSVAAPTAGLHITGQLRDALVRSGREWEEATLHVGYGTFSPVRSADIREHVMHAEYAELPMRTLAAARRAKAEGRAVIAVGTTSARLLEGVHELKPELFAASPASAGPQSDGSGEDSAFAGWIRTFICPGRPMRVIDGLITNFHLPGSSLLMLVAALTGRERLLRAYRQALDAGFRFFSYGDAMLIL
jgi:S-adenosylmethionine:tRNA ribosyltransferase-isomerase